MTSRRELLNRSLYSILGAPLLSANANPAPAPPAAPHQPTPAELMNRPRLERLMKEEGIDAIIGSTPEGVGYLSELWMGVHDQFSGVQNYAIVAAGDPVVGIVGELDWIMDTLAEWDPKTFTPTFSDTAWLNETTGPFTATDKAKFAFMKMKHTPGDTPALIEAIRKKKLGEAVVGVEDKMSMSAVAAIQKEFPKIRIKNASGLLLKTRMVKTPAEIESTRIATDLVCGAIDDTMKDLAAGMTSREIIELVRGRLFAGGGQDHFITADVGPWPSREPNYKLKKGDLVVIDAGCRINHRYSDRGVSMVFDGEPWKKLERANAGLTTGNTAGVEAARPGMKITELCDVMLKGIREHTPKYLRNRHVYGHSIGVECPEFPLLQTGNETELEPGMFFCLDVVYHDYGRFMLLVEDTVLITEKGCELLTEIKTSL